MLTIVLTPFMVAGAGLAILFFFGGAGRGGLRLDRAGLGSHFTLSMTALVGAIVVISLLDRRGGRSPRVLEVFGAIGSLLGLLALSLAATSHGTGFWVVFVLLSLVALGLAGRAYTPQDDYYLGWCNGWVNDPFTLRDDLDRAHLGAGFAIAIPRHLVDSYAVIFSSVRLFRPIPDRELAAAGGIFQALAADDEQLLEERLDAAKSDGAAALRLLHELELVKPGQKRLHLTGRGREVVKSCARDGRLV